MSRYIPILPEAQKSSEVGFAFDKVVSRNANIIVSTYLKIILLLQSNQPSQTSFTADIKAPSKGKVIKVSERKGNHKFQHYSQLISFREKDFKMAFETRFKILSLSWRY